MIKHMKMGIHKILLLDNILYTVTKKETFNVSELAKTTNKAFGVGIIDMDVFKVDPEQRPTILMIRHESRTDNLRYCHDT